MAETALKIPMRRGGASARHAGEKAVWFPIEPTNAYKDPVRMTITLSGGSGTQLQGVPESESPEEFFWKFRRQPLEHEARKDVQKWTGLKLRKGDKSPKRVEVTHKDEVGAPILLRPKDLQKQTDRSEMAPMTATEESFKEWEKKNRLKIYKATHPEEWFGIKKGKRVAEAKKKLLAKQRAEKQKADKERADRERAEKMREALGDEGEEQGAKKERSKAEEAQWYADRECDPRCLYRPGGPIRESAEKACDKKDTEICRQRQKRQRDMLSSQSSNLSSVSPPRALQKCIDYKCPVIR